MFFYIIASTYYPRRYYNNEPMSWNLLFVVVGLVILFYIAAWSFVSFMDCSEKYISHFDVNKNIREHNKRKQERLKRWPWMRFFMFNQKEYKEPWDVEVEEDDEDVENEENDLKD